MNICFKFIQLFSIDSADRWFNLPVYQPKFFKSTLITTQWKITNSMLQCYKNFFNVALLLVCLFNIFPKLALASVDDYVDSVRGDQIYLPIEVLTDILTNLLEPDSDPMSKLLNERKSVLITTANITNDGMDDFDITTEGYLECGTLGCPLYLVLSESGKYRFLRTHLITFWQSFFWLPPKQGQLYSDFIVLSNIWRDDKRCLVILGWDGTNYEFKDCFEWNT